MPKSYIDYSNTIIYKIICKDDKVHDIYIGHTTNFIQRKYSHKTACDNFNNTTNFSEQMYKTIQNNGGWENWDMIEVANFDCKNSNEARKKEKEYILKFNSKLNESRYKKINVNIDTINLEATESATEATQKSINKIDVFECKLCHYSTSVKCNYDKHLTTPKHQKLYFFNNQQQSATSLCESYKIIFQCQKCNKNYKDRTGLWRHNKKCNSEEKLNKLINTNDNDNNNDNNIDTLTQLVLEVVKSNNELQKQNNELQKNVIEMCKNGISNTNNIQNINSNNNNKTFNLNVFLNEYCKDAMNITDFIDSLKIQFSDFENVGRVGFVNGISDIIIKNLKALDIHKRPVHCSDSKREVMYIKDADKWEKENEEKNKLRKVIKHVANKNSRLLPEFKEKYPGCNKSDSKYSDQYNKLIVEAMGGSGDNNNEKEDKIIKRIAKEVIIEKD